MSDRMGESVGFVGEDLKSKRWGELAGRREGKEVREVRLGGLGSCAACAGG